MSLLPIVVVAITLVSSGVVVTENNPSLRSRLVIIIIFFLHYSCFNKSLIHCAAEGRYRGSQESIRFITRKILWQWVGLLEAQVGSLTFSLTKVSKI